MIFKDFLSRFRKDRNRAKNQDRDLEKSLDEILMTQDRLRITQGVLLMGEKTHNMLTRVFSVMEENDDAKARSVIEEDREVDQMEMEINWDCMATIAMRQPVQDNLRFLFAVMKLMTDLERVGDESTNIARHLLRQRSCFRDMDDLAEIVQIRNLVLSQLENILEAFKNEDLSLARAVFTQDEVIDKRYDKLYEAFLNVASTCDSEEMHRQAYNLTLARHLERAGDHIVNIADYICFMLTGKRIASEFDPNKD